jgi:hypothetical protein
MNTKDLQEISKFNLQNSETSHVLIVGRRRTGKTRLIQDILNKKCISDGIVISHDTEPYDFLSAEKHKEYYDDVLGKFLDRQKRDLKINNGQIDVRKLVILDDSVPMNMSSFTKQSPLVNIYMNSGQYYLTVIDAQSHPIYLPPIYRSNISCVFIFKDDSVYHRKTAYKLYGGIFPSFELFDQYMTYLTSSPYHCMVIYNCAKSSEINHNVFWYCVDVH